MTIESRLAARASLPIGSTATVAGGAGPAAERSLDRRLGEREKNELLRLLAPMRRDVVRR